MLGALTACGGEDAATIGTDIESIQQNIFAPACATAGCHDAESKGGELDMSTTDKSYNGMINIPAVNRVAKANGWVNVKPGDPERSFLVRKLDGPGAGEGDPMPSEAQMLNAYYRDIVVQWIAEGAKR